MPHINILSDEIKLDGTLFGTPQKIDLNDIFSVQNLFLTKLSWVEHFFANLGQMDLVRGTQKVLGCQLNFMRNDFLSWLNQLGFGLITHLGQG